MLGCVWRANDGLMASPNVVLHGRSCKLRPEGGLGGAKYNSAPMVWGQGFPRQGQSRQLCRVTGGVVANYAVGQ